MCTCSTERMCMRMHLWNKWQYYPYALLRAETCSNYNKIQPVKLINMDFKPEMNKFFKWTFHNADRQAGVASPLLVSMDRLRMKNKCTNKCKESKPQRHLLLIDFKMNTHNDSAALEFNAMRIYKHLSKTTSYKLQIIKPPTMKI